MGAVFLVGCAGAVVLGLFARLTEIGNEPLKIIAVILFIAWVIIATPYAFPSPDKDGES
jgi:hypothetical protein